MSGANLGSCLCSTGFSGDELNRREHISSNVRHQILNFFGLLIAHDNMQAKRWWTTTATRVRSELLEELDRKIASTVCADQREARCINGFFVTLKSGHFAAFRNRSPGDRKCLIALSSAHDVVDTEEPVSP